MAKKGYIGISGKARKIKKAYLGISSKARKIKKAYIGIGGVARPCWTGGELEYYGIITGLATARYDFAGAPVGNYAVMCGGINASGVKLKNMEAYNRSLVRTVKADTLTYHTSGLASAANPTYAIFAGGLGNQSESFSSTYAFNSSLVVSKTSLGNSASSLSGASVGDYAIFTGGYTGEDYVKTGYAFSSSLTRTACNLSVTKSGHVGASNPNYALFTGGGSATTNAFNSSLVQSTPSAITSTARYGIGGGQIGNYAVFAGGTASRTSNTAQTTVEAYNTSLVKSTLTSLATARTTMGCGNIGNYLILSGGRKGATRATTSLFYNVTEVYNLSLVRSDFTAINTARSDIVGVPLGDYLFLSGGYSKDGASNVVDVFTV